MNRARRNRRRQLDVSHQKNWLTGLHPVRETLTAARWPIARLVVNAWADGVAELQTLAETNNVPVECVSAERLEELCHARHHQGVAAQMAAFPYRSLDWLTTLVEGNSPRTIVICDRIQDAFNFGAILRCAAALNVDAMIIGESEQVGVSPQVARSSAGAVNHMEIVRTDDLANAVTLLANAGISLAAASEKATAAAWEEEIPERVALVIGNEAAGIDSSILEACNVALRIPISEHVDSLNAAVAAGILLYEIQRQRNG